jgi:DNA processing protein
MTALSIDASARLALMACIEGGSPFWTNEIANYGAPLVLSNLRNTFYTGKKNSADRITEYVQTLDFLQLEQELADAHAQLLTPESEAWPAQLEDLANPPFGLIYRGDVSLLRSESISIVGSRNPTSYGVRVANEFASGLADREWTVISGGAYGIDTSAHQGALAAEGRTIAVLGSGLNQRYPTGNERLFKDIELHGLLISEVLPNVHAHPARFLIRNRIIASLSRGTIVVEAAYRSGSLRTARDAAEIFRVVMATPGSITSPASDGCHKLIANREAELVTSIDDVMELVLPLDDARMAT